MLLLPRPEHEPMRPNPQLPPAPLPGFRSFQLHVFLGSARLSSLARLHLPTPITLSIPRSRRARARQGSQRPDYQDARPTIHESDFRGG